MRNEKRIRDKGRNGEMGKRGKESMSLSVWECSLDGHASSLLGEFRETPIYAFTSLTPGNVIIGPAIIEADLTTVVLPPGQRFSLIVLGWE